jgi:hypothetical protein
LKNLWLCVGLGLLAAASAAMAKDHPRVSPAVAAEVNQVMETEQARVAALDAGDLPALERILGDDLTYVHASGRVDTKSSFLDAIRSGQLHYISWQAKSMQVRVLDKDSAVLNGEYAVRVSDTRAQPQPFDISIFILGVYARRNGQWQQVAWQSTRDVRAGATPGSNPTSNPSSDPSSSH